MQKSLWATIATLLACFIGLIQWGCEKKTTLETETISVTDQLGRNVAVPKKIERIAATHHFGGMIVYALGQQEKLVEQALYGRAAMAMTKIDPAFAARPKLLQGRDMNVEELVALRPQVVFVYASLEESELALLENAGLPVIAVAGETLEESFEAVKRVADILGCQDRGEKYLEDCRNLLRMVRERVAEIPKTERMRVIFAGPKSAYTVATGEMLQTRILEAAGALNMAADLRGFWADISPEQLATWNPDVIFAGSSLDISYGLKEIYQNPQFKTVRAIKEKRVYAFPSNIGWWDYPAPHCVLGVAWAAKTLYPERFRDLDMVKTADAFYTKYMGHSFTALGGRL